VSRYIGLIGHPVSHSISRYFQQAALEYYGLDIRYEAWETAPAELEQTVNSLRKAQNIGANVTVPYKEAVLAMLDEVDDLASSIGAVNTIVKKDNRLLGFNTDADGFMKALDREGHFAPRGKRVVMLGAGGVARAAGLVMLREKVAALAITNRTFERASALAESLAGYARRTSPGSQDRQPDVTAFHWENLDSARTFAQCDLIVHCTSMGMKDGPQEEKSPLSLEVIPKNVLVYDVVYNPPLTPLLNLAQKAGANILGGLAMLVYQGAASFRLWIERDAPVDIMLKRAKEMLTGGNA
jgi:shikimate dehydrogenase